MDQISKTDNLIRVSITYTYLDVMKKKKEEKINASKISKSCSIVKQFRNRYKLMEYIQT